MRGLISGVRARASLKIKLASFSVSSPGICRARLIHRQQSGYLSFRSALYEFTSHLYSSGLMRAGSG